MDRNLGGGEVGGKQAPLTPKGADGYVSPTIELQKAVQDLAVGEVGGKKAQVTQKGAVGYESSTTVLQKKDQNLAGGEVGGKKAQVTPEGAEGYESTTTILQKTDQNLAGGEVGGKKAPVTPEGKEGYESSTTDKEYGQGSEEVSADIVVQKPQASHKYDNLRVFNQEMCLIYTDENDILQVEKSVVAEFETIALPMVVVGVAGLYRTGKSYLLNIIAEGKGFRIVTKTKGIWVWCMMHPRQKDTVLVLLDSEGFGDVEKDNSDVHDLKIFTLVTLLCNVLIYNMLGVFDNHALSNLELVSKMSDKVKFNGKCNDGNLHIVLPSFALVLRDVTKNLEGKNGKAITADEYLENALENKEKEKREHYNKTRECIKRSFQKRRCFAMPPPGDSIFKKIGNFLFPTTCKLFQTSMSQLLDYVYGEQPKRLLTSNPIKGSVFANLVRDLVKSISEEGVFDVDATYTRVADEENKHIGIAASKIFQKHMEDLRLPVKRRELHQQCTVARDAAFQHVFGSSILDGLIGNVAFNVAKEEIEVIWKELEERNEKQIKEKCTRTLEGCSKYWPLKERVKSREFGKEDGIHELRDIYREIQNEYNKKLASFDDHERLPVWQKFAKEILNTESEILEYEQAMKLSEALFLNERLQKEQRLEREIAACREHILQEEISKIAQQMKDMCEREKKLERAEEVNKKNEKTCRLM